MRDIRLLLLEDTRFVCFNGVFVLFAHESKQLDLRLLCLRTQRFTFSGLCLHEADRVYCAQFLGVMAAAFGVLYVFLVISATPLLFSALDHGLG